MPNSFGSANTELAARCAWPEPAVSRQAVSDEPSAINFEQLTRGLRARAVAAARVNASLQIQFAFSSTRSSFLPMKT